MRLLIDTGILYVNNHQVCLAEAGNGRTNLPAGRYAVTAQFSHAHGKDLPIAIGLGFFGSDADCDVVLGRVRSRNGVLPCTSAVGQVMVNLELAEDEGQSVMLEIK